MFDNIIAYSVKNKFIIGLLMVALTIWGIFSLRQLPIGAVPDITNNQVMVITISPTLATQEVEKFITTPIELALQNLQQTEEIRSISRFGLSVVTVVFEEGYDVYLARQLVSERLKEAQGAIPEGLGTPELAPISTGLGEIYQYAISTEEGYQDKYSPMELRTIQDWIVKRQLLGIPGVAEINSMGGFLKQYEVAINPELLQSMNISIAQVFEALQKSNENTGGAYIEKNSSTYYIRSEGVAKSLDDIANIVIANSSPAPILIKDIATVQFGKAPRYGAMVRGGEEVVGGKVLMFKGANPAKVTALVKERVVQIEKSLPEGVHIEAYLVRDKLVHTAIGTVEKNLLEGGLIVIFILILLLGNWRAGLIVASVIPFAMLFAISMMNLLGISANLMSLGAIDFGLIIDGAVIIIEAIVHRLHVGYAGKKLSQKDLDDEVISSSQKIRSSAAFGEIIILMVYIPILALVGIEGKMFKPMAQTIMLAITGALILSLTYVPMMAALFLNKNITNKVTFADRLIAFFQKGYSPVLNVALRFKLIFVGATLLLFIVSAIVFGRMGGEFIPTLEEGDLAMQQLLPSGSSLSQAVESAKIIQKKLLKEFPEIEDIVVYIGSAEIPTDPMPVEIGDYALIMKPKSEWTSASSRQEMFEKIEESLHDVPGVGYEFSQPIQMRFNELMTGSKADIAIKLFGEDLDILYQKAKAAEKVIQQLDGVASTSVEQTIGMPQIIINYNYAKMAQYGLHIKEINQMVRMAFAGEKAGVIYEGEKRFDMIVRLHENNRKDIDDVKNLLITLDNGNQIPLRTVAAIKLEDAPMQVSRENTNRRIVIGVNVGNTDVETLVENIQQNLDSKVNLPVGYYFTYGGQFQNLKAANARLAVALPIALALIFILLFFTFGSVSQALLIFTAIPLSAIGGVWALELRGLPFSISAGIGFIALFGVAVLNGIVLIGYFNQLKKEGMQDIKKRILVGTEVRLRPVLMTAAVASLGFLPMAISNSGGAEVQRPLATVVIGGLISATFLTLVIIPLLYYWLEKWDERKTKLSNNTATVILPLLFMLSFSFSANAQTTAISLEEAIELAAANHPAIKVANLQIEKNKTLQNMKYQLGTTDISYQGNGLFAPNGQMSNQIGFVQNFESPAIVKAQNNWQDQLTAQSNIERDLTINELKYRIKLIYFDIQYQKELKAMYGQLSDTYGSYYLKAKVRVAAGTANALEPLNIQSKWKEYQLLLQQIELKTKALEASFQLALNSKEALTTSDSLQKQSYQSAEISGSIWLQKAKQNIAIATAKTALIQAEIKPSFQFGYSLQHYYDGGFLHGIQAGVSVSLFNAQNKKRVAAQSLAIEAVSSQLVAQKLDLDSKLITTQNQIDLYQKGITFYQEQLKTIQPEILRITQLNYQAGELSYLELLQSLQLLAQNNQNYWQQLLAYNQAVAYYQFISTK